MHKFNIATSNVKLANDVLTVLAATGCDILNYNFKSDYSVKASLRDLTETGRDINSRETGLLIQCPSNVQTSTAAREFNGDKLSFIDANGNKQTITIQIDGDALTVQG